MSNDDARWVPPVPEINEPPARFDDAWERGRELRRRRILASGGTSAALGVALLVALAVVPNNDSGGDSLRQVGPAAPLLPNESGSPDPALTLPPQVGPSALPGLPVLPGLPRTSPGPTGQSQPSPQPSARGGQAEPQAGDGERERNDATYAGSPSRPVQRKYESSSPQADPNGTSGGGQTVCGVDAPNRPSGQQARWCGDNDVTAERADFLLEHRQCRAHDGDQPALTFAGSQEVEYEVRSADGGLVWRWSDGVTVTSAAHELPSERGACYTWTTRWTPLDRQGQDLPAGEYQLRTWVTSAELGPEAFYESEFTIAADGDGR